MKNRNVPGTGTWRLYVIVDRAAVGDRNLRDVASAAIRGGADAIQLRDKIASIELLTREASQLLPLTQAAGIPLIVNDQIEAARASGADGVHLGQDDLPIARARSLLGPNRLIGKSTHSLEQALAAEADGADYIGFGPIFPTPTKPGYRSVGREAIRPVAASVRLPVVCIGGIDRSTLEQALESGAECVAVVRAVCAATDPEIAARELKHTITQYGRVHSPSRL